MLFYSPVEIVAMAAAAIVIDWVIGDPRWPKHPVIRIGQLIAWLERLLYRPGSTQRLRGMALALGVTGTVYAVMLVLSELARRADPWIGYAVNTWFISTTIAVKGLKDAALQVYRPLQAGDLPEARKYTGYIVGRDTLQLEERDISRAAVETVAENTVDAFVSPLVFALLGAAPLAMLYRAVNTLDSMVGYKNERYLYFGWASARLDDILNWIPARLTGLLLAAAACFRSPASAGRAVRAIAVFAHRHPSPNSGIPESAVAGALGVELGGRNFYGGTVSDRARMGWPLRELRSTDILAAVYLLYGVSAIILGGLLCVLLAVWK